MAASVNGAPIPLADFELRVDEYTRAMTAGGLDAATQEGQAQLAQMKRDLLEGMIDAVLVRQAAPGLGVWVTTADVDAQIELDIASGGGEAAFDEWLRSTGQTRALYADAVRQSLVTQRVVGVVARDVPTTTEQVHVRQIVVDSLEAAQAVVSELEEGADFALLAEERSADSATRDVGGDLGWLARGLVAPELETAVFALKAGEISGPVSLAGRFYILQVVEREAARPVTPEMQAQLKLAALRHWLDRQRSAARIERLIGE